MVSRLSGILLEQSKRKGCIIFETLSHVTPHASRTMAEQQQHAADIKKADNAHKVSAQKAEDKHTASVHKADDKHKADKHQADDKKEVRELFELEYSRSAILNSTRRPQNTRPTQTQQRPRSRLMRRSPRSKPDFARKANHYVAQTLRLLCRVSLFILLCPRELFNASPEFAKEFALCCCLSHLPACNVLERGCSSVTSYLGVVAVIIGILATKPQANITWQCWFAMSFITVQLLEAVLWLSISTSDAELNDITTRLVLLALWTQPLVNTLGGALTSGTKGRKLLALSSLFLAFIFCFNIYIAFQGSIDFITVKSRGCHLIWKRSDIGYFMTSSHVVRLFYYGE